ncbi:methyltransf_25 domain-containing protein [Caerostris extrusa]|uniref:Methyltransf_25 domain-containing protein n=1 Tax=Caerostris extrusa TaxID=172846 RepID=A0AAV4VJG4_CAEEX|nr:methyltransf_25 domain-containing protein [Caerostris extrusa]
MAAAERDTAHCAINPTEFSKSQVHLQSVQDFLLDVADKANIRTTAKQVVLDVGCGPGMVTKELMLPLIQEHLEKFYAFDVSPVMIEIAKQKNSDKNIEYFVADMEDWYGILRILSSEGYTNSAFKLRKQLEHWEGRITTLMSIHCFNWVRDQRKAFEHVKKLLKPNGVACLLFPLQATFYDAMEDIKVHPKWKDILMGVDDRIPESHQKKWDYKHYLDIVQELGFEIVRCESRSIRDVAVSDDHYKLFFSSLCVFLESIPESKREEFKQDFFEELLKKNGRTGEKKLPYHDGCMLDIIIKKPAAENVCA